MYWIKELFWATSLGDQTSIPASKPLWIRLRHDLWNSIMHSFINVCMTMEIRILFTSPFQNLNILLMIIGIWVLCTYDHWKCTIFSFINLVQCVWPVKFEYCVYDPWNWGILCVALPLKIESCASPLKFEYRLYDNFKIFILAWSSMFEYLDSTYRIPWLGTQLFSI